MWEIEIPYDWQYGQWEQIRLYPSEVKIYFIKCSCGERYWVYPSFYMEGTKLTLTALIFIAYAYTYSELTWRDIPEKFCAEEDKISHSALYKAVHGYGKSMLIQKDKIDEGVQKLHANYQMQKESADTEKPRQKALYEHTREREGAVQSILLPLSYHCKNEPIYTKAFYAYLRPLRLISSALDPPVLNIYSKINNKH